MRAARLVEGRPTLEYVELPTPAPAPGWALLEVRAAGLCHTDLHLLDGVVYAAPNAVDYTVTRPRVPGHEIAGVVSAVGDPADQGWIGRRVAVGRSGRGTGTPGMHFDGGFAEYCAVPVDSLVPVPDAVDFEAAAVATDSIATAYSAVVHTGAIGPDDRVAVIGLGGLGLSAVRVAVLQGATVFGVDVEPSRFPLAEAAGAHRCVTDMRELAGEQLTAAVDLVSGPVTGAALDAVGIGGRVVLVGMSAQPMSIAPMSVVLGRKRLLGALGSRPGTLPAVLDLLAAGELTPVLEPVPFDELDAAFDRMRAGRITGRFVTRPTSGNGR